MMCDYVSISRGYISKSDKVLQRKHELLMNAYDEYSRTDLLLPIYTTNRSDSRKYLLLLSCDDISNTIYK